MAKHEKKQTLGLTVKRDEDFSEWYTQVIQKAELADYTSVSGCIVFRPNSFAIWEMLQAFLDEKFKKSGVKNAYFPMLIPESLLIREKEHVEGFTPEVAWVTQAGDTKLSERLAIRPTSETIMYDTYAKWIRSHNELPLRLNQWTNIVRWEFKHAIPFLRTREFLWQEGHSVFSSKEEAEAEVLEILGYYTKTYEEMLAVPVVQGKKTDSEKFAGAVYSTAIETYLPVKKAIQASTSHFLGQNFSKAFGITFLDKDGKRQYAWQNSWGFSTRALGIMILMHSDDKGLVLPPKVAPIQVVIIPIFFDKTKSEVLKKAAYLKEMLTGIRIELDSRENYSSGWKFNDWELKGVPIRIEIGPKDMEKKQVIVARRDTGEKEIVKWNSLKKRVGRLLEEIQESLYTNAKRMIERETIDARSWESFLRLAEEKKWIRAFHCGEKDCELSIKEETQGVKTNCIPFKQPRVKGKCIKCKKQGKYLVLFAKSY